MLNALKKIQPARFFPKQLQIHQLMTRTLINS